MFTCNCPDALIRATICKHIHLLVRTTSGLEEEGLEEEEGEGEEESMDVYTVNSHLQSSISSCREGIQKQLATQGGYVSQADDIETLQEIKSLITAALNISKVNRCKATLPLPSNEPANKNIAVQRPFFSTKRKRKPANVTTVP